MSEQERARLSAVGDYYADWGGIKEKLSQAASNLVARDRRGFYGLELGWGAGVMHRCLAKHFECVDVVEGAPLLAQTAMCQSKDRVFNSLFEEFESDPIYSDVIMAWVLEHVEDPVQILRRAQGWLAPGGAIHIFVSNANSIHRLLGSLAGILGQPTDLSEPDQMIGHRRVHTWAMLQEEIETAGLEVVHMEGILVKPFPISGMDKLTEADIQRLFELAPCCPELCAEVYAECRRPESC